LFEGRFMDISVIFKIAAIGIVITVVCQILKKSDREDVATLVTIVGLVIVLTVVISMIGDLFDEIKRIFELY
jgi:stage III sporulation protein AC